MSGSPLKVLQLSYSDTEGGAFVACLRGHLALQGINVESHLSVKVVRGNYEQVSECEQNHSLSYLWKYHWSKEAWKSYWRTRPWGMETFSSSFSNRSVSFKPYDDMDLIHLHWITDFVDLRDIVKRFKTPWVWTLHDMNLLTGGCHYAFDCNRYLSSCGNCPQLGAGKSKDLSFHHHRFKQDLLKNVNEDHVRIVTPSQWLADHVASSPITSHLPIEVIPYGIDVDAWRPLDKKEQKIKLGLDPRKTIVLFVAEQSQSRRKGFLELMRVLKALKNPENYQIVSVGEGRSIPKSMGSHVSIGAVRDEKRMIEVFNACDIFVVPSLQDNLPNVILESMACGTPVVAFDSGGIGEMIDSQSNGILVETGDIAGMKEAIEFLTGNTKLRREMGVLARKRVCSHNSLKIHGTRLVSLYQELLASHRKFLL